MKMNTSNRIEYVAQCGLLMKELGTPVYDGIE